MTIAGYEYIGRKNKSLLWNWLRKNSHVQIRLILLDSSAGIAVVEKRAAELRMGLTRIDGHLGEAVRMGLF